MSTDSRAGTLPCENTSTQSLRDLTESLKLTRYLGILRAYFDSNLHILDKQEGMRLTDPALGSAASCSTQAQAAALYAIEGIVNQSDGLEISGALLRDVSRRQGPSGGFAIPYNQRQDEPLWDIAELGAAADALALSYALQPEGAAGRVLLAASDYVVSQASKERGGAIYKNDKAKHGDILNGDVYGALVAARAHSVSPSPVLKETILAVVENLLARFKPDAVGGWWPYMEDWSGVVLMGNSAAYQATIIAHGRQLLPYLSEPARAKWAETIDNASRTLVLEFGFGPSPQNEVPAWSRDWEHIWEIYQAFASMHGTAGTERARLFLDNRLERLSSAIVTRGAAAWNPRAMDRVEGRAPVSSQFRKCASFSGTIASWCLPAMTNGVGC